MPFISSILHFKDGMNQCASPSPYLISPRLKPFRRGSSPHFQSLQINTPPPLSLMYMMQMYTVKTRNSPNNNKTWCYSLFFSYACIFREQRNLQGKISLEDDRIVKEMLSSSSSDTFYIGGMDISFFEGDNVNACAALVVCSYPDLEVPKFLNHAK